MYRVALESHPLLRQRPVLIKIRDLEFRYPDSAFQLRVGALDIAETERIAFVGRSGCGKTTLANLIAGILPANSGEIRIGGRAIHGMNDRARRNFRISEVGFVFQDYALLDYLNVEENILLPFYINSTLTLSAEQRGAARDLADKLGIADKLKRHPGQLSGGEKQRVAICRALSASPSLIIADEPTGNLDAENSAAVTDLICEIAAKHQATLIMVTHDHLMLDKFDRSIDIGKEVNQ